MYMMVTENFTICLSYYTVHHEKKIVSDDTAKDAFLIDVTSMKNVFFWGGGDNFIVSFMQQWTL